MSADLALYATDRPAWLRIVAPKMAVIFANPEFSGGKLSDAWGLMQDDYKAAVWALLDTAGRDRVRRVRAGK